MKKILTKLFCTALVLVATLGVSGCNKNGGSDSSINSSTSSDSSVELGAPITDFSVSVTGIVSFKTDGEEACVLYCGERKLVEIEVGDDISALVTDNAETYTVRVGNQTSNGVKVYKPDMVTDFAVIGTAVSFTAEEGKTYTLLVNGEEKGAITSGSSIRDYLGEGACALAVALEGAVEGETIRLRAVSNVVTVNAYGDNDVEYNPDWLQ